MIAMADYRDILCMGCMSVLGEDRVCRCGFDESTPVSEDALPYRTVISGKYIVGREIYRNGEEITYIGFNTASEEKVYISEFFPFGISKRNAVSEQIVPVSGMETQFKVLKSDFEDLYRGLSRLTKNDYIIPVLEVVSDNGTIYGISKYVRTVSFRDYLQHNGGEFTWPQAKKLFMPLFTQLSNLHAEGFVHRGISSESIRVNAKGQLLLSRFGTSDLYFKGSLIETKLNEGYSAPEEYSGSNRQGEFTDVYSIAAVLYRTLTGTLPVSADARVSGDDLIAPEKLEESIPSNVSDAIMNAMTLNSLYRLQTVDEFTAELLEESGSNTVMFSPKEMEEIGKQVPKKEENKKSFNEEDKYDKTASDDGVHVRVSWGVVAGIVFFVILLIAVIIVFKSGILGISGNSGHSGINESNAYMDNSSGNEDEYLVTVPNFIGRMKSDVEGNNLYEQFNLVFEESENQNYTEGMIFEQSVKYRTQVNEGYTITLKVSTGAAKVPMPQVVGYSLGEAENILNEAGIVYQAVANYSGSYEFGKVYDQSVKAGEEVATGNTLTKVYIYYSASTGPGDKTTNHNYDSGVIHIG